MLNLKQLHFMFVQVAVIIINNHGRGCSYHCHVDANIYNNFSNCEQLNSR